MTPQAERTMPISADWRSESPVTLTPILQAALDLIQANGYHGTTVREVSARVGLTMPSIYYHHGNKEGLLVALLDAALDSVSERLEQALAEAQGDTHQELVNFITAVALHTTYLRDLASLHSEYRFLGEQSRENYVHRRTEIYQRLADIIDRGAQEELLIKQDGRVSARAVLGMLLAITEWYHVGGPLTPDVIATQYVDLTLRMLGSREATSTVTAKSGAGSRARSRAGAPR